MLIVFFYYYSIKKFFEQNKVPRVAEEEVRTAKNEYDIGEISI